VSAPPSAPRSSAPPVPPRSSTPPSSTRIVKAGAAGVAGVRVCVERSATDERLFVVRRLEPHEHPVPGTVEARLLFLGPEPTK
jgi:hypothetical protein